MSKTTATGTKTEGAYVTLVDLLGDTYNGKLSHGIWDEPLLWKQGELFNSSGLPVEDPTVSKNVLIIKNKTKLTMFAERLVPEVTQELKILSEKAKD